MKKLLGVLLAAVCLFSTAALAAAAESLPGAASGDQATEGAAAYDGRSNAAHSPYFSKLDFYNEHSNERGLSVVSGFKTYQQTTESTCGPSCALMVLEHDGVTSFDELGLARTMGTLDEPAADGQVGTSTEKMVKFFKSIGWLVQSSLASADKLGDSFENPEQMGAFFIESIKAGVPVMVENMYYGGHWRVVIGYDTMNTPQTADDVLLLADPYDVNDQNQNGYTVEGAEYFYFTWLDIGMLPENQRSQQWLTAAPPKQ